MIFGTILPMIRFAHVYVTIDEEGEVDPSMDPSPLMVAVLQIGWLGLGCAFMISDPKPTPEEFR